MSHETTEASLSMAIELASQADRDAYNLKTSAEQHTIKSHFLGQVKAVAEQMPSLLEVWMGFEIAVDPMYHECIPPAKDYITAELVKANSLLPSVTLSLGDSVTPLHCAKTFDCGHICGQSFALEKQDSDGKSAWTLSKDGVNALVTINMEWVSPPAS